MSFGQSFRWYAALGLFFVLAVIIAQSCGLEIAAEVGAVMIATAVFFGSKKIKVFNAAIASAEDQVRVEKRKLKLDAYFVIAGTLVNGFSSTIHFLVTFIV